MLFHSVPFSSVAQSCPTLCDPMNRSTPGFPVHHQLPEFTQTHIHRVSDTIQPSHPLSSPSPPAPSPSQHQSLFQWVNFVSLAIVYSNCMLFHHLNVSQFIYCSNVDRNLSHFHFLAITNNAAINTVIHVFVQTYIFNYIGNKITNYRIWSNSPEINATK